MHNDSFKSLPTTPSFFHAGGMEGGGHEWWGKVQVSVHHGEERGKQSCGPWGGHLRATDEDKHYRKAEECALNLSKQHLSLTSDSHSCIGKHSFWSVSAPLWVLFAFCFSLTFPSPSPFTPLLLFHHSFFSHKPDCLYIHLPMFHMNFPSALKFSCTFQTLFPLNPTKSLSHQSYLQSNPHHPLLLNDFTLSCVLVYLGCISLLI